MIARMATRGETVSTAWYSECGTFRYRLARRWAAGPVLTAVLLNPSTATEADDDPTVARLVRRARAAEFGGVEVLNLFALRDPDPAALRRAADPVGPQNDAALQAAGDPVLCGWGRPGGARGAVVAAALRAGGRRLLCLGRNRDGSPRHPLYVAAAQGMEVWDG
jgi:hypothetical protein